MSAPAGDDAVAHAAEKAVKNSRLNDLVEADGPMGGAIWSAVGKTRGVVESVTPGVGFLSVYTLTADVVLSVSAPVVLALVFIGIRLLSRTQVLPAIAGLIGITASATVAMVSGRAEDNFLLGFGVNGLWIAALLVSVLMRKPLAGWVYALLKGDSGWRANPRVLRMSFIATWMWVGIFGLRLALQVPLYFAGEVSILAIAKLVLGVPLYAAGLWVTWLMFTHAAPQKNVTPG